MKEVFKKIDSNRNDCQEIMYNIYKSETKLSVYVFVVLIACTVSIGVICHTLFDKFMLCMFGIQIGIYCKYLYDRRKTLINHLKKFNY
jgi:hypothetical protein